MALITFYTKITEGNRHYLHILKMRLTFVADRYLNIVCTFPACEYISLPPLHARLTDHCIALFTKWPA